MPAPVLALSIGCVVLLAQATTASAQIPDAIGASAGEAPMLTIHAEGAQIYECKVDPTGKLTWQFREPIAALMIEGKTVGRHFAGPNWELVDGSAVGGKVIGRAPGSAAKDIAWLKLEVTSQRGAGQLTGASSIQRINTKGAWSRAPVIGAVPSSVFPIRPITFFCARGAEALASVAPQRPLRGKQAVGSTSARATRASAGTQSARPGTPTRSHKPRQTCETAACSTRRWWRSG